MSTTIDPADARFLKIKRMTIEQARAEGWNEETIRIMFGDPSATPPQGILTRPALREARPCP